MVFFQLIQAFWGIGSTSTYITGGLLLLVPTLQLQYLELSNWTNDLRRVFFTSYILEFCLLLINLYLYLDIFICDSKQMQIKKSTHSTCKMHNNNNVCALFLRVSTTYLSSNGCRHLTFIDEPIEIVCARALTQIPIDIPINSTDDNNFDSIRVLLLLFRLPFMYMFVAQRTANSDYEQSHKHYTRLSVYQFIWDMILLNVLFIINRQH